MIFAELEDGQRFILDPDPESEEDPIEFVAMGEVVKIDSEMLRVRVKIEERSVHNIAHNIRTRDVVVREGRGTGPDCFLYGAPDEVVLIPRP